MLMFTPLLFAAFRFFATTLFDIADYFIRAADTAAVDFLRAAMLPRLLFAMPCHFRRHAAAYAVSFSLTCRR